MCCSNPFPTCWASLAPAFLHPPANNSKPLNLCIPNSSPRLETNPPKPQPVLPCKIIIPQMPSVGIKPAQPCTFLATSQNLTLQKFQCPRGTSGIPEQLPQNPSSDSVLSFFPCDSFHHPHHPLGHHRNVAGAVSAAASI